jgi:hypothetical protein
VHKDFIRAKAKALLKEQKAPVDLEKVAERLGVQYEYHCEANCSFSLKCGDRYVIGISITGCQDSDRQAFAQQLGHIVLGHFELYNMDSIEEDRLTDQDREKLVEEAMLFAKYVLESTPSQGYF